MTDAELRGRLLSHFYDFRHKNGGYVPVSGMILSGLKPISDDAIAGVCRQLADAGLIEWTAYLQGPTIGSARITGPGVDAVERGGSASLEIRFPDKGVPVMGHSESEFDAAAEMQVKFEEAARADENLPTMKFSRALERARARRASSATEPQSFPPSTTMPTVKESERVTIAEGLAILERHLPADQAKARILRAFVQKTLDQEPLFALPYDEAEIDWATGSVKIPRKRERFCPTFSRAEFEPYFFEAAMTSQKNAPAPSSPPMAKEAAQRSEEVKLKRDPELLKKLLIKLEEYPLQQGRVSIFNGKEPELAIDGYSSEQIAYHLQQLSEKGLIDSPGGGALGGVTFAGLSSHGHDFLERQRSQLANVSKPSGPPKAPLSRKVFIVHGHDEGAREAIARFLTVIDFQPIILHEQASQNRTVIEKVEHHGDVDFAVVLLTPDDIGGSKDGEQQPRARQNVILELGYFIGRLGRERVCALKRGELEIPSDFGGVVYEKFDASGGWKQALGKELRAAGYDIDWNKVMR